MPQVKVKQVLASHYQDLVSKNSYDKVKEELESYDTTNIETLITANNYDAPYYCYIKCTLFRIKKKRGSIKI